MIKYLNPYHPLDMLVVCKTCFFLPFTTEMNVIYYHPVQLYECILGAFKCAHAQYEAPSTARRPTNQLVLFGAEQRSNESSRYNLLAFHEKIKLC